MKRRFAHDLASGPGWLGRALPVLCAALLAACAAQSDSRGVRPIEELPERYQEVWGAWLVDDPRWPELRDEARADPQLVAFLVDNLVRELLRSYGGARITSIDDDSLGPFERARAELVILQEDSTPVLVELLAVGNGTVAQLSASILVEIGRPSIDPLITLLERESEDARTRAAALLGELPHARTEEARVLAALAERLDADPFWLVRSKSAQSLGLRGSRGRETAFSRKALTRALGDPDVAVTREAARGLARLEDRSAVPALINYLERSVIVADPVSLRVALASLRSLTGVHERLDVGAWRDWWSRNGTRPQGR